MPLNLLLVLVKNAWKAPVKYFFTVSAAWNSATSTWNKQFPRVALREKCPEKPLKIHR